MFIQHMMSLRVAISTSKSKEFPILKHGNVII